MSNAQLSGVRLEVEIAKLRRPESAGEAGGQSWPTGHVPAKEEVSMLQLPRRVALTFLAFGLVLILAAPLAAETRQGPPPGWLEPLTQQLARWVASWWSAPVRAPGQSRGFAAPHKEPRVTPDCGPEIDMNGHCG